MNQQAFDVTRGKIPGWLPEFFVRWSIDWNDPEIRLRIGSELRHLREKSGKSPADVGKAIKQAEDAVRRVELGENQRIRRVGATLTQRYADHIGLDLQPFMSASLRLGRIIFSLLMTIALLVAIVIWLLTLPPDPLTAQYCDGSSSTIVQPNSVVAVCGAGDSRYSIDILIDDVIVASATINDEGKWSAQFDFQKSGEHQLEVRMRDADNKVIATISPIFLGVATLTPTPLPTHTPTPTDTPTPTFTPQPLAVTLPNQVPPNTAIPLRGRGEPGFDVRMLIQKTVVASTTVTTEGSWSLVFDSGLPGQYTLETCMYGLDGSISTCSDSVVVAVATYTPTPTDTPTVTTTPTPTHTPTATFTPQPLTVSWPPKILLTPNLSLNGTGEPGYQIEVLVQTTVVASATIADDGRWAVALQLDRYGEHQLEVRMSGANGIVATLLSEPLAVATPIPTPTQTPGCRIDGSQIRASCIADAGKLYVLKLAVKDAGQTLKARLTLTGQADQLQLGDKINIYIVTKLQLEECPRQNKKIRDPDCNINTGRIEAGGLLTEHTPPVQEAILLAIQNLSQNRITFDITVENGGLIP